jgi:hypothetical protein
LLAHFFYFILAIQYNVPLLSDSDWDKENTAVALTVTEYF